MYVTESTLEDNMLECLQNIDWKVRHDDDVAPDSQILFVLTMVKSSSEIL